MDRLADRGDTVGRPLVEVTREGDVAWIELADPKRANCLSVAMMHSLENALSETEALRIVVLLARGRNFCGGFDTADSAQLSSRFLRVAGLLAKVRALPVVTVAIVQGGAVGAGADLATHCDLRLALTDAFLRFPGYRKFGVVLGSERLAGLVGFKTALEAMASGRTFDAVDAQRAGLVDLRVDSSAEAAEYVRALAGDMAAVPLRTVPGMVAALRQEQSSPEMGLARLGASLTAAAVT